MSTLAMLINNGVINANDIEQGAVNVSSLQANSHIASAINFYQFQQDGIYQNMKNDEFYQLGVKNGQSAQLALCEDLARKSMNTGSVFEISLNWFEKKGNGWDACGHTVLGYGLDTSIGNIEFNGITYTKRILIYDCSNPYADLNTTDLYYNDDGEFCVPGRGIYSTTADRNYDNSDNGRIVLATDDAQVLNTVDYVTGKHQVYSFVDEIKYIGIQLKDIASHIEIKDEDTEEIWRIIPDGSVSSNSDKKLTIISNSSVHNTGQENDEYTIILPDCSHIYSIISNESGLNCTITGNGYFVDIETASPGLATVNDNCNVSISTEDQGEFSVMLVSDEPFTSTNMNLIKITSDEMSELNSEIREDGIIVSTDASSSTTIYRCNEEESFVETLEENQGNLVIDENGLSQGAIKSELNESMLSSIENKVYAGKEIKQGIVLKDEDIILHEGVDYVVSYENNINVGTAKVIITGIGSYSGTIEKEFEITPKNVTPTLTLSDTVFYYTGQSQKPTLISVNEGDTVFAESDFDVTWPEECINSGIYDVIVTLKGNYAGSGKASFTIKKLSQTVTAHPWRDELGIDMATCCTVDGIGRITYSSSDPSVVTVDSYGWLTGCSEGTAIITVTANGDENHLSGQTTFEITVKSVYAVSSGPCGENATWTYYNNGTIEINGTGSIELRQDSSGHYLWDEFYTPDLVWGYEKVDTVIINEGITEIGNEFFSERSSVGYGKMSDSPEIIIIADSVNTINKRAFINCSKLKRVSIGAGVTTIGACAFSYCPSLKEISISENNEYFTVVEGALYSKNLKHLYKLPNDGRTEFSISQETETVIEDALGDLDNLKELTVPKSVKVFEDYALDGSNKLTDVYYEGSASGWASMTIGEHNNVLESVNLHYAEIDKSWQTIDGVTYYFDENGNKVTGWQTIDGEKYYFDKDGSMHIGWLQIGDKWYYFRTTGVMHTGMLKKDGKYYYFKLNGEMLTGWLQKSGKMYYFKTNGQMLTGWLQVKGKRFYFKTNGQMLTGWLQVKGKKFYFKTNGQMHTGWLKLSGKYYYFKETGQMVTGRYKIGNKWYTFSSNGVRQ